MNGLAANLLACVISAHLSFTLLQSLRSTLPLHLVTDPAVDVNKGDYAGTGPLHLAASEGHMEIALSIPRHPLSPLPRASLKNAFSTRSSAFKYIVPAHQRQALTFEANYSNCS